MDLNLDISDEEEVVEETSRPGEQSGELSSVLMAICGLKQEMNSTFGEIRTQVSEIAKEQSALKEMLKEISLEQTNSQRSLKFIERNVSGHRNQDKNSKRLSSMKLQQLAYAFRPERAVVPLLTWAVISTVMSYVRAMPSLRFWVSDAMRSKMAPHGEVIDHSQGLAMLLFAVKNNSKAKLATPPGKIWAFLMRRALRSGIIFAKANLFRKDDRTLTTIAAAPRTEEMGIPTSAVSVVDPVRTADLPLEPEWMSRFANNSDIGRAVEDAMQKFEGTASDVNTSSAPADSLSEGPSSRPRKRRKSSGGATQFDHELRMHVVKHVRSLWLEKMNQGRTAVRAYLYKKFVFILDKISQFKDVDTAAQKGYRIVLGRQRSAAETIRMDSRNLDGGIWNIPDAYGKGVMNSDQKNHALLRRLTDDFPSLHAKIFYKKHVKTDTNEVDIEADLAPSDREYLSVTEDVSFHEIANEMLVEIFSCPDSGSLLVVSQLSLKAIHVLAIALRGLVSSVLAKYSPPHDALSEMELAAFGKDVTLDDEKEVSVKMEKHLKNGKGRVTDTYASCYRDKFTISKDDAEELRKSIEAQGETTSAQGSGNLCSGFDVEQDDVGPEDWIHKK